MPQITIQNQIIPYTIRKSKRARRIIIKVGLEKGVEVVVPHGAKVDSVEPFLRQREDWLLQHHLNYQQHRDTQQGRQFISGETLPFLDDTLTLDVSQKARGQHTTVQREGDILEVRLQADLAAVHFREAAKQAIEGWYRQQAKAVLIPWTYQLAEQHGFTVNKISIRGQKTRWGSCSSNGNLNLNWRLLLAPSEAVAYVIIHELCHLREMNHSRRFWSLVESVCPEYRTWRKWLKDHGAELHL